MQGGSTISLQWTAYSVVRQPGGCIREVGEASCLAPRHHDPSLRSTHEPQLLAVTQQKAMVIGTQVGRQAVILVATDSDRQ
jgi:hypothetical protein